MALSRGFAPRTSAFAERRAETTYTLRALDPAGKSPRNKIAKKQYVDSQRLTHLPSVFLIQRLRLPLADFVAKIYANWLAATTYANTIFHHANT